MGICASMKKSSQTESVPYKFSSNLIRDEDFSNIYFLQNNKLPDNFYNKPGNPGTWDELHKKVTDLYPRNFDGLQIIKSQKLSEHFKVNHTFIMSGTAPTGYRFGASYNGVKRIIPKERYPSLKGDIMPNGNMTASFIHAFGCRCRFKINTQIDRNEYKLVDYGVDYRTDDFTVSAKISNIDPFKFRGQFTLQYLQAITPRIAIGAEVSCWKDSKYYPIESLTNMSGALRYSTGRQTISTVLGEDGLHISYHHVASRELELGVKIKTDLRNHKSEAAIAYKYNLDKMDAVFHGIINTETSIGAVIEKKLLPISDATLLLSAFLNHKNQRLLVGIGLNVDSGL